VKLISKIAHSTAVTLLAVGSITSVSAATESSHVFTATTDIQTQILSIEAQLAKGTTVNYSDSASLRAIAAAAADHPPSSCLANYTDTSLPMGKCTQGATGGSKTMVLLGDSHAWQWIGPLNSLAKARNWKFVSFAKASCPDVNAIFTLTSTQRAPSSLLNRPYVACATWRDQALAAIRALKPYVIVMSGEYRAETMYTWPAKTPITDAAAESAMQTTLKGYLTGAGARLVNIADTPYEGIGSLTPAECLSRNPRLTPNPNPRGVWPHDYTYCYRPYLYDNPYPAIRSALSAAATTSGVTLVDPAKWFCDTGTEGICPPILGGVVTFTDAAHIANSYALQLAPLLGAYLPAS